MYQSTSNELHQHYTLVFQWITTTIYSINNNVVMDYNISVIIDTIKLNHHYVSTSLSIFKCGHSGNTHDNTG
jgi:hypothetical protein